MHGDKPQAEREQTLAGFRDGSVPILFATDVAARGLDVKDVRVVVNYDCPQNVETYIHRIGRTGRAGASGHSWTLITIRDSHMAPHLITVLQNSGQWVPQELHDLAKADLAKAGGSSDKRANKKGNKKGGKRGGGRRKRWSQPMPSGPVAAVGAAMVAVAVVGLGWWLFHGKEGRQWPLSARSFVAFGREAIENNRGRRASRYRR